MPNDPDPVARLLKEVARGLGMDSALEVGRVFSAWEAIVGPDIARKCRPVKLHSGILRVEAASAAWANQLRYLAPKIASTINQAVGREMVKEVQARVSTERFAKDEPPQPNDRLETIPKPSSKEIADADKITSEIGDPRLAEAAKRALLAAKMRKKKRGGHGIL